MQRQAVVLYSDATECCANCKYFHAHYVYDKTKGVNKYTPLWHGHCTNGRMKRRDVANWCEKFEWREIDGSED